MGRLMSETRQPLKVYVVDDDAAVVESTAFLIRTLGHECATFDSPETFLARIDGLACGCVLSDLRMPGMTGYDLASALRARSVTWPMLLMSSEHGPDADRAARAHGFAAFLPKPLDSGMLATALDEAFMALSPNHD
jgi:two-component system, LuxR family, response regulator FixJ